MRQHKDKRHVQMPGTTREPNVPYTWRNGNSGRFNVRRRGKPVHRHGEQRLLQVVRQQLSSEGAKRPARPRIEEEESAAVQRCYAV